MVDTLGSVDAGGPAAGAVQPVPGDSASVPASPNVAPSSPALSSDAIDQALSAAPELARSPGAAVAVGTGGGDVTSRAQAVAQAGNRQGTAAGFDRAKASTGDPLHTALSWLGHNVAKPVGTALGDVAKAANTPLRFVQHEYRYLHDVEARHGIGAAVAEGIGITLGAAGGTLIAGPEGFMLGAEGAGALEGQLAYRDSWSRTSSGDYRDPHTGKLVSFGRDIAGLVGLHGSGFNDVSGVLDAIGDYTADPLALAGKVKGAANSVEGIGGALGYKYSGLAVNAENVDHAYANYAGVRRAFETIAGMDAGTIARFDQRLAPIADLLGRATTGDEVAQVLKEAAKTSELGTLDRLPTMSFTKMPLWAVKNAAKDTPYLGGQMRRLEQLPGATWDPVRMEYSSTKINPSNLYGLPDIMRLARFSETEKVAQGIGSAYAYASPAERIGIFKNVVMNNVFALAHVAPPPDDAHLGDYLDTLVDADTKKYLMHEMSGHIDQANPEGADAGRVFGTNIFGKPIAPVVHESGAEMQGAVTQNQVGSLTVPSLVETRRMAQAIHSTVMNRLLAGTDDFLYHYVTQGFFKPLVLQSGGYALHISFAEMFPNAARLGMRKMASAAFHASASKLGFKADERDLGAFTGWMHRIAGKVPTSEHEAYIDGIMGHVLNGYGHTNGLGAGENIGREAGAEEQAATSFRTSFGKVGPVREGTNFGLFGSWTKRFPQMWQDELRENARDEPTRIAAGAYRQASAEGKSMVEATELARRAVAEHLRSLPEETLDSFVRAKYPQLGAPEGFDPIDSFASAIVEKMKGAVHGSEASDFKLHVPFLNDVAEGKVPKIDDIARVQGVDRPLMIKGRDIVPDGSSPIQRLADVGFRKVLNPMVNFLSRDPLMRAEFGEQFKALESSIENGTFTTDEAATLAASRATAHSMRFVHNLHDRTQWTATMRNWAPFYFAQEQAYRRMGRLLVEDPGAFRRYQLEISSVHDITAKKQDSNGNQYIVFPGSGWLGKTVPSIFGKMGVPVAAISPAGFGGSFSAANVIFPLSQGARPGLGPVMAVPAQALGSLFPELGAHYARFRPIANVATSAITDVVGSETMSSPIWEQLVPNTFVQRIIETAQGSDRAFNSSFMQTLQALDYEQNLAMERWVKGGRKGEMPDIVPSQSAAANPLKMQAFLDKVKNQTRILYGVRAILGLVSPVSADVEIGNYGLPTELNAEIAKQGSVSKGITAFLAKNPEATPYTVFQSTNTSGAVVPESVDAENWIDNNMSLIQAAPFAAMWLMPQMGKSAATYSPAVYNEQLAQGIRAKRAPADFLTALYVAAGNATYYAGLSQHEAALDAIGNNNVAKSAEYTTWDNYVNQLEQQAPVWATDHLSGDRYVQRQQTIKQLRTIFAEGKAPAGTQSTLVKQLLDQFDIAQADYQNATQQWNYTSAESAVNDQWEAYTSQLATAQPALAPIITSVFKDALPTKT